MTRPSVSDICAMLNERPELVTDRYCSSRGAHRDHQGRLWCLSPIRPDRRVGSFHVALAGPWRGRWRDEATGDHGDMLDLIREAEGCDLITAIRIARSLLGIEDADPALAARMERLAEERRARRAVEEKRLSEKREAARRSAQRLWLSGQERIAGTPVDFYLASRGIRLAALGRQPRALRYHPAVYCNSHDPETGEVVEGRFPAMLAAISGVDGSFMGCHRTYLAQGPAGRWGKAPIAHAKKVMGLKQGGCIRIWSGTGPRGGKGTPLNSAPAGSRVYLTEGIEDALSVVMLKPDARVVAAVDLGNMGAVALPPTVTEVVLCADNDGPEQAAALERAVEAHARAGRTVRLWRNAWGGKDVNDALMMAGHEEGDDAAA